MPRIIYYYQTFASLKPILVNPCPVSHIHLSSIHFGNSKDGFPYIHLNDYPPDDPRFNTVWSELEQAHKLGVKIVLMVGGAGGAFTDLFNNFDTYYDMLKETIKKYPIIQGIDLDVEETVDLDKIRVLINRIDDDFGDDFIISMAPVSFSLEDDTPGFGGFVYKDLFNTPEGQRINYFNGQFYGSFDFKTYDKVIENGYPEEKINIGMISSDFSPTTFCNALDTIRNIKMKYPNFGGTFVWEYSDCPPCGASHPDEWAVQMHNVIYPKMNKVCKWVLSHLISVFLIW